MIRMLLTKLQAWRARKGEGEDGEGRNDGGDEEGSTSCSKQKFNMSHDIT